jgi:hemoglobin
MDTIETRKEISILVNAFYAKIRKDELLGPIFNGHIPEAHWPEHLSKLTDFWETNLFGIAKFKGNPSKKHINVDKESGHTISQLHFGKWLQLWFETVDELFEGELATKAKESARKMATGQFLTMWNNRPDEHKNNNK